MIGRGDWLWRGVLMPGAAASTALLLLYFASVDWQAPLPADFLGYVLGRDFLNFWTFGREAWGAAPGRFYDIVLYNEHLAALVGENYPTQQWSYPPHLMLLTAPFGLLPYLPALALWTGLGMAALLAILPAGMDRGRGLAALAFAPAGLACLISGQVAFFVAALLVVFFRCLDSRPVVAGILLGLLTVKPQLGVLFPLMLLVSGRWTTFAAASATTLALVGATALLWGWDVWERYLFEALPLQRYVIDDPTRPVMAMMPTAYMNARIVGLPAAPAYAIQGLFAAAALAAVVWTFLRRRDPLVSAAILVVAGLAATPYLMSYDLVVVAWLLMALASSGQIGEPDRPLALAVHLVPFVAIAGEALGLPGSALILPAFGALLLRRLAEGERVAPAAPPQFPGKISGGIG